MFLQFRWQLRRMMWNDRTCGRHALNKLLQGANFTDDDMARIQLRTASSVLEDAALHGDPRGDWSIEVLGHALRSKGFDMQMRIPAAGQTIAGMLGDSMGMLNWVGAHYIAYIRHSGAVYCLDSASSSVKWAARHVDTHSAAEHCVYWCIVPASPDEYNDSAQSERAEARRIAEHTGIGPAAMISPLALYISDSLATETQPRMPPRRSVC